VEPIVKYSMEKHISIKKFPDDLEILNDHVDINLREQEFIETYILGPYFPWFWQDQQTFGDEEAIPKYIKPHVKSYNGQFLSHTLLLRTESESVKHTERPGNEISSHFEFFLELFNRFMVKHDLKYTNIFRANLNLTWHNSNLHTAPHLDHHWPHKNFIMYLTSCDQGQTIIWPDDFSTSYMIPCVQYTAVTFKQHWHAQRYPSPGSKRAVLVITYI
jgi:hypothetical protein